ncbi:hypothetical protein ACFPN2_17540 [Steroidobacter flavus]|uniref:Uncharacterized protein n=1 Tax=Steroidobacter flavus TaxID=1842136 RepID=A0ABV8STF2_9GAMM
MSTQGLVAIAVMGLAAPSAFADQYSTDLAIDGELLAQEVALEERETYSWLAHGLRLPIGKGRFITVGGGRNPLTGEIHVEITYQVNHDVGGK